MATGTPPTSDLRQLWEDGRARSLVAVLLPVFVLFLLQAISEVSPPSHSVDDFLIVVMAIITSVVLIVARRSRSIDRLVSASRLGLYVAVGIALAGVLGVLIEYKDPTDLMDDPLTIVGGVLAVLTAYWLIPGAATADSPEYRTEWLRTRTTYWFSLFFVAIGINTLVFSALAPLAILMYVEGAALVAIGALGLVLFERGRCTLETQRLHSINNLFLIGAIVVIAVAAVNFDFTSLGFAVVLVVNRFV